MSDTPQSTAWFLHLAGINPADCDTGVWRNPFEWEGAETWTPWGNCSHMVVNALDEASARQMAAEFDCGIWLDPAYARCVPFDMTREGVVVAARDGARYV